MIQYKIFLIALFVLFLVLALYPESVRMSGNIVLDTKENETVIIGYCPTMSGYANLIASQNKNVDILEFGSASIVMSKLNSKEVDIALIGRKARIDELGSNHERVLKPGFTLVSPSRYFIGYSVLKDSEIITYTDKEIAEFFPELNLKFVQNKVDAFKDSNIVLIPWDDYEDSMELVIPLSEDRTKVEKFRTPIIYSSNGDLIEEIKFTG